MWNEFAQWFAILTLVTLTIAAYRELGVILQPSRLANEGLPLGSRLPSVVRLKAPPTQKYERVLVGVVAEGCQSCERFLSNLRSSEALLSDWLVVLVAQSRNQSYLEQLRQLGVSVVADTSGDVSRDLNVHATPLILVADRDWRVQRKGVTHRVSDFLRAA